MKVIFTLLALSFLPGLAQAQGFFDRNEIRFAARDLNLKAQVLANETRSWQNSNNQIIRRFGFTATTFQRRTQQFEGNIARNFNNLTPQMASNFFRSIRSEWSNLETQYNRLQPNSRNSIDQEFGDVARAIEEVEYALGNNGGPGFNITRARYLARELQRDTRVFLNIARNNSRNTSQARQAINRFVRFETRVNDFNRNIMRNNFDRNHFNQWYNRLEQDFNYAGRFLTDISDSRQVFDAYRDVSDTMRMLRQLR